MKCHPFDRWNSRNRQKFGVFSKLLNPTFNHQNYAFRLLHSLFLQFSQKILVLNIAVYDVCTPCTGPSKSETEVGWFRPCAPAVTKSEKRWNIGSVFLVRVFTAHTNHTYKDIHCKDERTNFISVQVWHQSVLWCQRTELWKTTKIAIFASWLLALRQAAATYI